MQQGQIHPLEFLAALLGREETEVSPDVQSFTDFKDGELIRMFKAGQILPLDFL